MPNYPYVSKKCRSLVRELSLDPFSPFTSLEMVIGFRACYNLALVLYLGLEKESGVRINWNMIRDRLIVISENFANLRNFSYYG